MFPAFLCFTITMDDTGTGSCSDPITFTPIKIKIKILMYHCFMEMQISGFLFFFSVRGYTHLFYYDLRSLKDCLGIIRLKISVKVSIWLHTHSHLKCKQCNSVTMIACIKSGLPLYVIFYKMQCVWCVTFHLSLFHLSI